MRTYYNKLIRDRIPEIISASGKQSSVVPLSPADYLQALKDKLIEEAQEAVAADPEDLLLELSDLSEVIDALLQLNQWSQEDLSRLREERRRERGGFTRRLKLLYVEDSEE
jgi:predicted house-cleaning noncanonical NTP pyrophosphatase (MazG superfamily)